MTIVSRTRPTALVTGAAQGLGLSTAARLAQEGFDVVVADVNPDTSAVQAEVEACGGRFGAVALDLADVRAHADRVDEVWKIFGGIDCLVNNGGVASRPLTDVLEVTPEAYDRVLDVNLRGTFFLSQAVARRMRAETSPHHRSIITVSSIAARMVNLERAPYHLSKAGLSMMNELLAMRLAEYGIAAYEVRPGYMRTAMTASAVPEKLDASIRSGRVPARRWGAPSDVAETVTALATGRLPFSTGQAIWVDGGLHMGVAD